ncbi:hypothetical protein T440DRAFT_82337 [Plenodomus tracheiphilus IPT5]|uniref:Uncharacterized protein n=1 Tax=Plenodomus tracheiphilus IPT5 TaxID=1408161 RepID=A0A6A7B8U5_9PLEO|nr:hypothetical protein T440DRAFT_82337 [Plenodomus tracheiphilus IPT5]
MWEQRHGVQSCCDVYCTALRYSFGGSRYGEYWLLARSVFCLSASSAPSQVPRAAESKARIAPPNAAGCRRTLLLLAGCSAASASSSTCTVLYCTGSSPVFCIHAASLPLPTACTALLVPLCTPPPPPPPPPAPPSPPPPPPPCTVPDACTLAIHVRTCAVTRGSWPGKRHKNTCPQRRLLGQDPCRAGRAFFARRTPPSPLVLQSNPFLLSPNHTTHLHHIRLPSLAIVDHCRPLSTVNHESCTTRAPRQTSTPTAVCPA